MEMYGVSIPTMNWDSSNLPEAWDKFVRHAKLVFSGPLKDKSEVEKVSYLLLWVGDKGRDIQHTWSGISEADAKKLETYYTKFKDYVQPKLNPVFARFKFNNIVQGSDSTDAFITKLKLAADDCKFGAGSKEDMIRDRIVFGCSSTKLREKLLNVGEELTLDKATNLAQTFEYAQMQLRTMAAGTGISQAIDDNQASGGQNVDDVQRRRSYRPGYQQQRHYQTQKQQETCGNCGTVHSPDKKLCPAYGKQCHKCKKYNHFKLLCRSRRASVHDMENDVHSLQMQDSELEDYYIDTVSTDISHSPDRVFVTLDLGPNRTLIKCKIDSGSAVNTISRSKFQSLSLKHPLQPSDCKLTAYSGDTVKVLGKVTLECRYKENVIKAPFYVVENNSPCLIGLRSSLDLELIKFAYSVDSQNDANKESVPPLRPSRSALSKTEVMKNYGDLFTGIGVIPGSCHLHLKENAVPVINPPRRVPEALKPRLKSELDKMVMDGIIAKVEEPTDWVHSIVIVEKPKTGKLRVCLDPKALNDAIRRPHYPSPTLDDVTAQLTGAKRFSILDITHAYWSVKLDDESSKLTCFGTPFGRYRYLRLPFGISSSGDIFQQKVDEIFNGLSGIQAIVDDILVSGRTDEEHDKNLKNVLARAKEKGIRFNPDKCIIGVSEVPFFGHIISSDGLKPDPSKIEAIMNMQRPESRAKLESFLGMVNYLAKFAPNLSEITAPLRALLKKETEFLWDAPQNKAFLEVKSVITRTPVLGYYDPSEPLVLEVDASKSGLGACLMQNGQPIAFASKSMTQAEVCYAQIEKELLAILFGCKRFHQYTYGNDVTVYSDHKPISSIMLKPLHSAPPRLQRMLLQLQKYRISVQHKSGKDIPISDCLSRHSLAETYANLIEGLDQHVHTVKQLLFVTDVRLNSLKSELSKDSQMTLLKRTIANGWPNERSNCRPEVSEFWNHRDELSVEDDLIFRGQTLIVPRGMREHMLSQLHSSHLGVTKTIQRAKDSLFWPGMAKQITDFILQCPTCLTHRDSNTKEPMTTVDFPDRPFQKVGADLFYFDGKMHLLTIDYYSRFWEVDYLPDSRSATVIRKLQVHMARNGIVDTLITDNGPQFSNEEFADFAKSWKFKHQTSSPLYPKGNGLSEKGVGIAKKLMLKAKESGQNPYLAFLEYRNTPLECGYTPAQLLLSRRTKSIIPITSKALNPETISPTRVKDKMNLLKNKQKQNYDKTAKPLPDLPIDDSVRMQCGKIWKPGKVVTINGHNSFTVHTRDGGVYRRNRSALHKTREHTTDITAFQPKILADEFPQQCAQIKPPSTPPQYTAESHSPEITPSVTIPNFNAPYITRSGRVVKEKCYDSRDWVSR